MKFPLKIYGTVYQYINRQKYQYINRQKNKLTAHSNQLNLTCVTPY